MKAEYYLFGWKDVQHLELAKQLEIKLGIRAELHESSYLGEYELFKDGEGNHIKVLPDFHDEHGSLYKFPGYRTFIELSGPTAQKYTDILHKLKGTALQR